MSAKGKNKDGSTKNNNSKKTKDSKNTKKK